MITDLSHLLDPSAVSDETAAFNARLEAKLAELPDMTTFPADVVRASRAEGKGVIPPGGPLEGSDWVDIPGAPGGPARVRISEPEGEPVGVYLHIHGGGWTLGGPDQSDSSCQAMAEATGMRVVSAAYRLAPEHPWPAQKMDCMAAARWVLTQTDLPVVIGGESAGAHLSGGHCDWAAGTRGIGPTGCSGLVLFYGCYDLRGTPSAMNWGPRNLILSTPIINGGSSTLSIRMEQARHREDRCLAADGGS